MFCRTERWRFALKRSDILNIPAANLHRRVVCGEHFQDEDYYCAERRYIDSTLIAEAVPSLFVHTNTTKISPRRKPPTSRPASTPHKKRKQDAVIVDLAENSATAERDRQLLTRVGRGAAPLKASTYRSKISRLNLRCCRTALQLKAEKAKRVLAETKLKDLQRKSFNINQLPSRQQPFVGLQMRSVNVSRVREFTAAEKEDALALWHRSPSACRHMRSIHVLPSETAIRSMLSACMVNTGPCPILLQAVKCRMEELGSVSKHATIGFDAMSLTPAVRYHEHLDKMIGFEDVGVSGCTDRIANQALVAVLRGINGSWKMPIAYWYICDNPSQERFRRLIDSCIKAAFEAGVIVRALTCDQERTQWAALKKLNVTSEKPFFEHVVSVIIIELKK